MRARGSARARSGSRAPRAALAHEGVSVDLGGIAKGWALDRMLPLLRERGIERALLDFGQSSVWALGAPPGAAGWRLLARGPDEGALGVLTLSDQALSVSGSLGQWVEIGGRRYGHVLDPRSGLPLERRRQALVVAPNAALAEALSQGAADPGRGRGHRAGRRAARLPGDAGRRRRRELGDAGLARGGALRVARREPLACSLSQWC